MGRMGEQRYTKIGEGGGCKRKGKVGRDGIAQQAKTGFKNKSSLNITANKQVLLLLRGFVNQKNYPQKQAKVGEMKFWKRETLNTT